MADLKLAALILGCAAGTYVWRGLGVWVWTVNEPGEMRRLIALGVDAIFSDYPERFAGLSRPS